VLQGSNRTLVYYGNAVSGYDNEVSARFFLGDWQLNRDGDETTASREDIMMVLANVEHLLIK